ncbi:MAG TPA: hypothetical protein VFU13_21530 [Steroidobacteraceae bacterium]|nr:hypothetical protein [Steroidobacteraceae bacterium]
MKSRELFLVAAIIAVIVFEASLAGAANTPPLSGAWNIASSGKATSSGELLFRVTPGDGGNPVEVTVYVATGTNETGVAGNIRRAFNTQLRRDRYDVEAGAGNNVLVKPQNGEIFSVELMDSDVENVRVLVQSATPVAPPTVPRQATPANPPAQPATPPAPGDAAPPPNASAPATPPANSAPPANASQPAQPPFQNSPAMPNPTPPPDNSGAAGTPPGAPPPNATPGGSGPASAPPPNATPGGSGPASAPPPTAR